MTARIYFWFHEFPRCLDLHKNKNNNRRCIVNACVSVRRTYYVVMANNVNSAINITRCNIDLVKFTFDHRSELCKRIEVFTSNVPTQK